MNILNLFARIGLKADTAQAEKIQSQFKTLTTTVKGVSLAMAGISLALFKITDDSLKAAVAFKQFEAETGASSEELQKWQAVAGQTNVSTEALSDAVKSLADNRQKIKLGQGNISGFQFLGIDPDQDPFQILEQLKAKTEGLAPAMKKTVLSQMGISSQLIQVLELTNAQFEEMKSNAFVIPKSAINTLSQANATLNTAGKAIDWIRSLIAVKLAPEITKITKLFINWIKENKEGIIKGFKMAFDVVSSFVTAIVRVATMFGDIITKTIGWKNAIFALVGVFVLLNSTLLLSPIGLITAGILALILVMEDLYVYSKGGKSLFGEFAKANPEFKKMLDGFIGILKTLADAIKSITIGDFKGLDAAMKKWGIFGDIIKALVGSFEVLKDFLSGNWSTKANKAITDLHLTDQDILKGAGDFFSGIGSMIGLGKPSGGSNTTVNNTNNVNVTGYDNPREAAQEMQRRLDQINNKVQANRPGARVN